MRGKSKSDAEIKAAIRCYESGNPPAKVAKIMGWSIVTVIKYLREAGVYQRPADKPGPKTAKVADGIMPHLAEIHRRNAAGESVYDLAKEYGFSKSRIYELLREHYHTFPDRGRENINKPMDWDDLKDYAQEVADEQEQN